VACSPWSRCSRCDTRRGGPEGPGAGIGSGSLALLADAGHALTDVAGLGLALNVAGLLRLHEAVPDDVDVDEVSAHLARTPGVRSVHDLHA